ncbi:MAG: hypothetical protein CL607_11075 [Anaerolineaceae bacterium]|nr:hypothetical protein [Anaerolineaceae bacterium]
MTIQSRILVTGASGYIAMHVVQHLLQQGYAVRGTLRSTKHEARLRSIFAKDIKDDRQLDFVTADLMQDAGWDEAMQGLEYVMHVASPVPSGKLNSEDDLIQPALQGTRRVMQAAHKAGIKRVVMTSSVAAMHDPRMTDNQRIWTESDWADPTQDIGAYPKSKALAERAAWDFVADHPDMELATINPVYVIGPVFDERFSTSIEIIRKLLRRDMPGLPRLSWSIVDTRDVAAAHLLAMTTPEAAGKRFCVDNGLLTTKEIAIILDNHFAEKGYRIPTMQLPDFAVRLFALFDQQARLVVDQLGHETHFSNEQAKRVLGWQPRPLETTLIDAGQSLIDLGLVKR